MGTVYYLAFGYTDRWYSKYLTGYTHVVLIIETRGVVIGIQPLHSCCVIDSGFEPKFEGWEAVLKIKVRPSRVNRLIGFRFQTCATFVQYIMGISTGAYLCQTLYDRLTSREYAGVEVTKWNIPTNC